MKLIALLPAALGIALLGLAPVAASDDEAPTIDLTGTWLRGEAESDDVEEKAEEARALDPQAQPGITFGRRGGRPKPAADQDSFARMARGVEVLQIEHRDPQITVTNANRETRVAFTDGRTLSDGLGSETLAHWSGSSLVVETRSETDKLVETYRLESPQSLVVITEIQRGRRDRVGAGRGGAGGRGRQGSPGTYPPGGGFPGGGAAGPGSRGQGSQGQGSQGQGSQGQGAPPTPPISFQFRTVYERIDQGDRDEPATDWRSSGEPEVSASAIDRALPAVELPLPPVARPLSEAAGESGGTTKAANTDQDSSDQDSANQDRADRDSEWYRPGASTIRILPPSLRPGELLRGKVLIQTLTISPAVEVVEFHLDQEQVAKRGVPPYEAKIELADPPREQTVEVVAFDGRGNRLGADRLLLNRLDPPFRVRITAIEGAPSSGRVKVEAKVSVPRKAEIERVELYRNETLVESFDQSPISAVVATPSAGPTDFVRVLAKLRDGRELEDVQLIQGFEFGEEIEVHLVQLQVLVTDKGGFPITGLAVEDFEVTEGGKMRVIDRVYPSRNVALNLGLSIDSSGSMRTIWQQTRNATERFLDQALSDRDRAFLVDFDSQLRLLQSLTGNKQDLFRALGLLEPEGNTALYDSIVFSLLQFTAEPGRRALIVFTDGVDSGSKADPKRAVEFGQQLGVPVYVIALSNRGGGIAPSGGRGINNPAMADAVARSNLKLITGPTGGRLFQVLSFNQVVDAFEQIDSELRSQYVLTYYSENAPGEGAPPNVKVLTKGAKVRTALPLDLAD